MNQLTKLVNGVWVDLTIIKMIYPRDSYKISDKVFPPYVEVGGTRDAQGIPTFHTVIHCETFEEAQQVADDIAAQVNAAKAAQGTES